MKLLSRGPDRIKPPHRTMGDALRIDCIACQGPSLPSDPSCMRCICFLLIDHPATERVMIRQYDDRVIRGDAVSVLKDLALCLSVIASLEDPVRRHCASCASSSASMMEQAWEDFPDIPSIASAPSKMRRGCANCLEKTQNALDRSLMIYKAGVQRASYLAFSRTR